MNRTNYLNDTTSHPLATADLHILEPISWELDKLANIGIVIVVGYDSHIYLPRNPLPPATTILFAAAICIWCSSSNYIVSVRIISPIILLLLCNSSQMIILN